MSETLNNAPEAVKKIMPSLINDLDVRPILQSGGEPFSEIMGAISKTSPQGALRLRATFEPKPLFKVLGGKGWQHWVEYGNGDDWMVWFYQDNGSASSAEKPASAPAGAKENQESDLSPDFSPNFSKELSSVISEVSKEFPEAPTRLTAKAHLWTLDVRELPPPEPMEMTLAVMDRMPKGVTLHQLNQRVPQFLLPLLPERGLTHKILKEEDNYVQIEFKQS